ncbi:efflux transporter outer membrane subunit [Rhodanobacter sp. PCA2]|uniref:efflux transporter outer membrane subunit n=1 Tax=Rhodanobacter sp. PCA2 TaxID=2006117 RepID=UPI0015E6CBBC|nr:efflux transporter outer membrane subunit [Rhodanobacter sp. PCA2]MBA2079199.1 RND transporter [Rhodanobacter sp. PCA2]
MADPATGPFRRWRTTLLATAVALAGCSVAMPRLEPPIPAQWQHAMAAQAATPTDLHSWWRAFDDPALDALVDQALERNLDVAQAVERLRAARTLQRREGTRYLPGLHARTEQTIDPDASASYLVSGLDATWELGLFGRAQGTRREAQAALDAGAADLQAARVSLVAEVVRNWIELRAAQQQERLLSQIGAARSRQLELLQVRQRLQLAPAGSVDQAMAASAQAQAALAAPRQAVDAAAQRLAVLLGQNHPDPAWLQAGPQPQLGAWQLPGTPADLLRTRPEIARAEADVLRVAGELGVAHADRFPSVGLGASLIWATDLNNNRSHTVSNGLFSVGPLFDMPLFDWGMRAAAEHAKSHELKASVLAYRQAVLQAVSEVETALGTLQQQRQREQHNLEAWQALQRVDGTLQTRVKLKLESPLALADGQLAADQAAIELADARASRGLAYVALFKALGGAPLPADEAPGSKPEKSAEAAH